jgi:hypothetical protein
MPFQNEREFEDHIRKLITNYILPLDTTLILLDNKKTVDIMLCRNGNQPAIYFLEIKYYKKSHERLSTGHDKGGGFQPELLSKQPDYFKTNMRWILGNEDREGFWLLTNEELSQNLSGKEGIGKKYNNIKLAIFRTFNAFSERELLALLKKWLNI